MKEEMASHSSTEGRSGELAESYRTSVNSIQRTKINYTPIVNAASDQHQARSTLGIIVDSKFEYFAFELDRNVGDLVHSHFYLNRGTGEDSR